VAQPGLKRRTFSPDSLVPVGTTGTKGPYQPGLKTVFLLVLALCQEVSVCGRECGVPGSEVFFSLFSIFPVRFQAWFRSGGIHCTTLLYDFPLLIHRRPAFAESFKKKIPTLSSVITSIICSLRKQYGSCTLYVFPSKFQTCPVTTTWCIAVLTTSVLF
jgi:hypothetical protein